MSNKALKEQILSATDSEPIDYPIPEWGTTTTKLRPLDGESRFRIAQIAAQSDQKLTKNVYITEAYVAEALIDENGDQIFTLEERHLLARKNPKVVAAIYRKVAEISGLKDEAAGLDGEGEAGKKSERAAS